MERLELASGTIQMENYSVPGGIKQKTKVMTDTIMDLLFTDDCALKAGSEADLQCSVDKFSSSCTSFGLTISTKKTVKSCISRPLESPMLSPTLPSTAKNAVEERAAQFKKEKEEREKSQEANKQSHLQKQQEAVAKEEAKKRETARIQVRLPDGSSISQTFPSGEPLQSLHDFVSQQIGAYPTLSTTFPKRVFTKEDMSMSFLDLQLVPSAVVIAIPTRQSRSPGISSDSTGGVFSLLLTPIMMLWNMLFYLYCLIFGGGSGASQSDPSSQESSSTSPQTSQEFTLKKGQVDSNPESTRQARQRGNMHRLTDIKDDDDENATWNGNSTQQL